MEEQNQVFDICIVCAMYEEAEAVLNEFSERCSVSFKSAFSQMSRYEYRYTIIQNHRKEPLRVLVTWPSDHGPVQTGLDLSLILQEFRPRFAAMTGICAGDRKKVKLGDLIIAECAYLYEEGKVILGPDGQTTHLRETKTAASTSQVLQYAKGFDGWKEPLRTMKRARLKRELKPSEEPKRFIVPIASGMAVRSDNPFPRLREQFHRNTIALDMEAATFYRAFGAASHIHALVVKGVSDYGDGSKNDAYHEYAERVSATYLLSFIQEYVTEQTMPRRDMPSSRAGPSGVWNVPYRRNQHFTGRDDLLDRLERHLSPETREHSTTMLRAALTQPQAIKGLGGIGKTQIAVEYAYRSRELDRYTHIFWVNAANEEVLLTSFVALAELLPAFPAKGEADQHKLVEAVKRWLEQCQERWLLIFDNADDVALVRDYLPQQGNGSIVLTTRAHAVGSLATSIEVETMGLIEGTHLLLRRAQRFAQASDEEINLAGNIVVELDHFPLALDQAGAYIEETQCSFEDYLDLYRTHRQALLARRGIQATNYPDSVATTWSLSFQKVQQANPAAAELLELCAFLAPDHIPKELITDGAAYWTPLLQKAASDPFAFQQTIAELLKFSLVKRLTGNRMLSIHRLVQAVQRDMIERESQHQWAERAVRAVNQLFPKDPRDLDTWPQCLRYLDQAQVCYALVEQYLFSFVEAASMLNRAGLYLQEHALYTMAEPLYVRALAIHEQQLGVTHPSTAQSLNNLAMLYYTQGKYAEAEPLLKRALAIHEQLLGAMHPDTAQSFNNLAALYYTQGKYAEAEPLLKRALAIREQQLGTMHPDTAQNLNNLAALYRGQGKYTEAEPLLKRALAIREQQLGTMHPDTASSLNNLAMLYYTQGKYAEAEPLLKRALAIHEQQLGATHPSTAQSFNNLAALYYTQGKYAEAEPLYVRALAIKEQQLGVTHPDTAQSLSNLAVLYYTQGKYAEAEPLYMRVLAIREQQLGAMHPDTAQNLNNLAMLYYMQGKYAEAEPLLKRALAIREQQLGAMHPDTAQSLNNLAMLYQDQDKYAEAEPLYVRALAIREQQLGATHPDTAGSLNNLATLYRERGKYAEAEPLLKRALAIYEQELGPSHPDTAQILNNLTLLYGVQRALRIREQQLGPERPQMASLLNNLAALYETEGKYAEAEPLYQRVLEIQQKALGEDDLSVAQCFNNLAELYRQKGFYEQAEKLFLEALAIRRSKLGERHPEVVPSLNNLAGLYYAREDYARAEPLFQQALAIASAALGENHPEVAYQLNNLAEVYRAQARYDEAEALFRRALVIFEESFGQNHPHVATVLNNLASVLQVTEHIGEAEVLYRRALQADMSIFGPDHPAVATDLSNLATLLYRTNRLSEAESLYRRALAIDEASLGHEHPVLGIRLNNLASTMLASHQRAEAKALLQRASRLLEQTPDSHQSLTQEVRKKLEALQ